MSGVLIDVYQNVVAVKGQLMNDYVSLRFENKYLEVSRVNLEIFVVYLKEQVLALEDEKETSEIESKKLRDAHIKGKELVTEIL